MKSCVQNIRSSTFVWAPCSGRRSLKGEGQSCGSVEEKKKKE